MRLRLYLNGDVDTRGEYISLFLVITQGLHDSNLPWPFTYSVTFCLVDQSLSSNTNQGDVIASFSPDTSTKCFDFPRCGMNDGYGIKNFVSLECFYQNVRRFIKNNTMHIKMVVDFSCQQKGNMCFMNFYN